MTLKGKSTHDLRIKAALADAVVAMLQESDDPRAPEALARYTAQRAALRQELARRAPGGVTVMVTDALADSGDVIVKLDALKLSAQRL